MEQPEMLLKELGLTEYEAKACMVLIKFGRSAADRISSIGNIPLPRVYDTMNSLAERGLISISRTRPQTFDIINLKRFFEILKSDERKKIEEKIKSIDDNSLRFLNTISSLPSVKYESSNDAMLTLTKRGTNVEEIWKQLHNETKKEFLVFAGDISWINRRANEIKKLVGKNIKYKILSFKCTKNIVPNVKKAMKTGAEIRCLDDYSNELRGIISDGAKIYLIQKIPKPGVDVNIKEGNLWDEEIANYTGMVLTSNMIAKVFREYFYFLWSKSISAEEFLKKIK
jgi:sugar-specific transcriptional regulator TrmB